MITIDQEGCDTDNLCYSGGVLVTATAEESWPDLVARAVDEGWTGVEALAAVTGTVADVVSANASAYGQQVADVIWSVRAEDPVNRATRTFAFADCCFDAGRSRFSSIDGDGRYRVVEVVFLFRAGSISAPVGPELAKRLGVTPGARVNLPAVRDAALGSSPGCGSPHT